jgi:hypothetical protein
MFKIILIILVIAAIIMSVPALKSRAKVALVPVENKMAPHMTFATDPMKKMRASDKESEILGLLKQDHISGHKTPEPEEFPQWLKDSKIDPDGWGNIYYMFQRNDSMFIGSNGPDRVRSTPDDILQGMNW